jgi:hypothetical protein
MDLALKLAQRLARRLPAGIEVKIDCDDHAPTQIRADMARFDNAMQALIRCATHVLPDDDLIIQIAPVEAVHGGSPHLHISALNPGVAKEDAASDSMCRPFNELEASVYGEGGRSEFELAIMRHLAEGLNGEVGTRRQAEGGVCYWILLPYEPVVQQATDQDERTEKTAA